MFPDPDFASAAFGKGVAMRLDISKAIIRRSVLCDLALDSGLDSNKV